jgi:protein-L-isoaspartate O-methyltransferase
MKSSRPASRDCPLCGSDSTHAFDAKDRNRGTTDEQFAYALCKKCRTVFLADVPHDLARYYRDDYYQFDQDGEPTWKREQSPTRSAAYRVELLRRHVSPGPLIEIGSGTGAFAVTARNAGFDIIAIEMNEHCCEYLRENEGITAICSDRPVDTLRSLPPANAIAMWHVLEHLLNPAEVLELAAEKLEPEGVLAIAVPNPSSLQFRLLGRRWVHLDAPRHLCLIPPDALIKRGEGLGLRCVAITTADPDGIDCNLLGWLSALRAPVDGSWPWVVSKTALATARIVAPIERTGRRGAAITLFLRKQQEQATSQSS